MIWNTEKDFYGQSEDVQNAVYEAISGQVLEQATEAAGEGFSRVIWQIYSVADIRVKITYLYANDANGKEWAALQNLTIEKVN